MFVDLDSRSCLVVGGGDVALRKTRSLLERGARLEVVAPDVVPELSDLVDNRDLHVQAFDNKFCEDKFLVVAATGDPELNERVAESAKQSGALVNVVDSPEISDFISSAVFRRGDLQVAVSTGGSSPGLAARIRQELEQEYDETFGAELEKLEKLRQKIRNNVEARPARMEILRELANLFHEVKK